MGDGARGHQRAARREVGVDLEGRVHARDPRRDQHRGECRGRRAARPAARLPAKMQSAPRAAPARAGGRSASGSPPMKTSCDSGHERGRVHQQVHALVGLEVARVQRRPAGRRGRATPRGRPPRGRGAGRAPPTSGGSSIWNTRAAGARRAYALRQARAHGHHRRRVAEGVALQRRRRPGQRAAAGRSADSRSWSGIEESTSTTSGRPRSRATGAARCADSSTACTTSKRPRAIRQQASAMNGTSRSELGQGRARAHAADGQAAGCAGGARREWATSSPCAIGEQLDLVALRGQRAHHGPHGQRRAAHLEERLRGEEEDPQGARQARAGSPAASGRAVRGLVLAEEALGVDGGHAARCRRR